MAKLGVNRTCDELQLAAEEGNDPREPSPELSAHSLSERYVRRYPAGSDGGRTGLEVLFFTAYSAGIAGTAGSGMSGGGVRLGPRRDLPEGK